MSPIDSVHAKQNQNQAAWNHARMVQNVTLEIHLVEKKVFAKVLGLALLAISMGNYVFKLVARIFWF